MGTRSNDPVPYLLLCGEGTNSYRTAALPADADSVHAYARSPQTLQHIFRQFLSLRGRGVISNVGGRYSRVAVAQYHDRFVGAVGRIVRLTRAFVFNHHPSRHDGRVQLFLRSSEAVNFAHLLGRHFARRHKVEQVAPELTDSWLALYSLNIAVLYGSYLDVGRRAMVGGETLESSVQSRQMTAQTSGVVHNVNHDRSRLHPLSNHLEYWGRHGCGSVGRHWIWRRGCGRRG